MILISILFKLWFVLFWKIGHLSNCDEVYVDTTDYETVMSKAIYGNQINTESSSPEIEKSDLPMDKKLCDPLNTEIQAILLLKLKNLIQQWMISFVFHISVQVRKFHFPFQFNVQ